MLKTFMVSAAALLAAVSANALDKPSSSWSCATPSLQSGGKIVYCGLSSYTSGTTSTQLGTVGIDAGRTVRVVVTGSSALQGRVTPTLAFFAGSTQVGTFDISNSVVGNVVTFDKPYFTSMTISTSVPSTISSTNSLGVVVIETGAR